MSDEAGGSPGLAPMGRRAVLLGIGFEAGLIVVAFLLGWPLQTPPLATLHFELAALAVGLAAAVPMFLGLLVVERSTLPPLRRLGVLFDEVGRPFFAPFTKLDLACLSVLAGVGEEMLFRGVAQAALSGWLGLWWGVALASVLFGVLHALTPTYAILATLAGVYLGALWLLTDNLLAPILAHAAYDLVALLYLLRAPASKKG